MTRSSNRSKVEEWTERLSRFAQSNRSVAQFCEAEGVSSPSFYKWRQKLRSESASKGNPDSSTNPRQTAVGRSSGFQALEVTYCGPQAAPPPALTVRMRGGVQVQVADNLPAICAVMRALVDADDQGAHALSDHPDPGASAC